MKFKAFIRALLTFSAGFALCVFEFFVFGVFLMILGLLMFCMLPAANKKAKSGSKNSGTGRPKQTTASRKPSTVKTNYAPVPNAPAADAYAYAGSAERYFAELLSNVFPDYTISRDISPASLARPTGNTSWECRCGTANTGKFCSECGKARPNGPGRTGATKAAGNLSFVFYRNGIPCAAVILCGKYEWNRPEIAAAISACQKANVPCLRFIKEFRNSADYVVDRINSVLR